MGPETFPLAPMSSSIRWMTFALLLLPVGFLFLGLRGGSPLGYVPAIVVSAIYLFVWLWLRPTRFELSREALRIVWPLRRFTLPLAEVDMVEAITGDAFRDQYGWGMRIGAGGLWGGFGLLKTRNGTLRFYISRLDGYVLVEPRQGRVLLLTPTNPERFVQLAREYLGR